MRNISYILIACCFYLGINYSNAQDQQKADSVLRLINSQELSGEQEMRAYYFLAGLSSSPDDELKFGQKLLELASAAKNAEYLIKANQRIGIAYRLKGDLGNSLKFLLESAREAVKSEKFFNLQLEAYTEISSVYTQNGDSENALLFGRKTINILKKTDRKQELALNMLNLGYDHYLIQNYDSALSLYNEAEPLFEEIGMTIGVAYAIGNRSLVYWKTGNPDKAKSDLSRAIAILKPLEDLYGMADYYHKLGSINYEQNDWKQAIANTEIGLEMALQEGMKEQVRDASQLLFALHKKAGRLDKAIDYQSQYYAYRDSIQNPETTQLLAKLKAEYDIESKEAEIEKLLAQQKKDQTIKIIGAIVLILLLAFAVVGRRKANKNQNI